MGSPFGSGCVETSIIGPAGLPTLSTTHCSQPSPRVFPGGDYLVTVDAHPNAMRSVCRLGAVGGFFTEAQHHA